MEVADFNMQYWLGNTQDAHYTIELEGQNEQDTVPPSAPGALEATQIAGFSTAESDKFFGKPEPDVIAGMDLHLRPPKEVREAFVARHESLLKELD